MCKSIVKLISIACMALGTTIIITTLVRAVSNSTDECTSTNPCLNGGICVSKLLDNDYSCNCPALYFGEHCQYCKCFKQNNTCSPLGSDFCDLNHIKLKAKQSLQVQIILESLISLLFVFVLNICELTTLAIIIFHAYKYLKISFIFIKKSTLEDIFERTRARVVYVAANNRVRVIHTNNSNIITANPTAQIAAVESQRLATSSLPVDNPPRYEEAI